MGSFVLLCLLFTYRKDPHLSLQIFEAWALLKGYFIGLACSRVPKMIVAHATALTFLVFGVLTVLSFHLTKVGADLGFLQAFLAEALAIMVWSGMCSLVFGFDEMQIPAAAGALLFSVYIIFDTNQILKKYADDEYVAAAASLYLDVLNLFLEILKELEKASK